MGIEQSTKYSMRISALIFSLTFLFSFGCTEPTRTSMGGGMGNQQPNADAHVADFGLAVDANTPAEDSGVIQDTGVAATDSGMTFDDATAAVPDMGSQPPPQDAGFPEDAQAPSFPFRFYTPAWIDGGNVPTEYTCDGPAGWNGQNNPELIWENPPFGTAAFVMIFDDPAGLPSSWGPSTSGWRHWAFFTADASVLSIPQATSNTSNLPSGVTELRSGDNRVGYVPNCPPSPPSSYRWRIWAVNTTNLGVNANSSFSQLEQAAEAAKVASLQFVGVAN